MTDQKTIPENYHALLAGTTFAHVATIGADGETQNNPVWFGWDGRHIKFSQSKTRQKFRNVGRDPRVAMSIVDPENPYRYLEVRGPADHIEEDPQNDFINAMAKKYMGVEEYPYHQPGDERGVVYVEPRHTTQMGS